MADLEDVKLGIYRHYKGPLYEVEGLVHDANADSLTSVETRFDDGVTNYDAGLAPLGERICVLYRGLQLDEAHEGPRRAVRTLEDFLVWVCADPSHDSYGQISTTGSCLVRRFTYLGPVFVKEMLK